MDRKARGGDRQDPAGGPTDRSGRGRPAPDREAADFLRAMEKVGRVPEKDAGPEDGPRPRRHRALRRNERVVIDAELDLHRQPVDAALEALERFVRAHSAGRASRAVLVVTGKGHHTPGGVGVLRRAAEQWIAGPGKRWVRAFAEAPRRLGGRGAFVVWLKR